MPAALRPRSRNTLNRLIECRKGPSRKRFIGEILGIDRPADRDVGTLGAVAAAVLNGAAIVRVHEVAAARQVAAVCAAIRRGQTSA